MCCCIDPDEPLTVRRARAFCIGQLVVEIALLLLSLSTWYDGGYLGVGASLLALLGCITCLSRCVPFRQAFNLLAGCNYASAALSGVHVFLLSRLLAYLDDWCCVLQSTTPQAMAILLVVLICVFTFGTILRLAVACGPVGRGHSPHTAQPQAS